MTRRTAPIALLVAVLAAAWAPPANARLPEESPRTVDAGATVKVAESRLGRMLVDGRGLSLYLFTRDRRGKSRCYGACAKAWPPLLTSRAARAGAGAREGLLGTTRRRSGRRQVTYRGHPLYYDIGESRAGEVLCQDVEEFGGTWLVVSPAGRAIRGPERKFRRRFPFAGRERRP